MTEKFYLAFVPSKTGNIFNIQSVTFHDRLIYRQWRFKFGAYIFLNIVNVSGKTHFSVVSIGVE